MVSRKRKGAGELTADNLIEQTVLYSSAGAGDYAAAQYLPSSIGSLYTVETLSLEEHAIAALPESIGNLNRLEELSLERNWLKCLPEQLCQLTRLTRLVIPTNKLFLLPPDIGNLRDLEVLRLDENGLMPLPNSITKLTRLSTLSVCRNPGLRLSRDKEEWIMELPRKGDPVNLDARLEDSLRSHSASDVNEAHRQ